MRKDEFLTTLQSKLSGLPRRDALERLAFYSEMIDDRIEEGLLEEDAVNAVGNVDEIALQIKQEISSTKDVSANKRKEGWKIASIVLGFPVWFSLLVIAFAVVVALLVSAFAVVVAFYASLFALVVSLWAMFVVLVAVGVASPIGAIFYLCLGFGASGFVVLGAGLVCAGLAVFAYFGCLSATKASLLFTKSCAQKLVAYGRRTHNG